MEYDMKTPPSSTADKNSFAYVSARDRWPIILTGAIDDLYKAVSNATGPGKVEEGKRITEGLAKLKHELQHDRQLTPLPDDNQPDVAAYNKELEQLGSPTWFNMPWLYAECYLYRRMNTLFSLSQHWRGYDVFRAQKISTFRSSRPAVLELSARYNALTAQLTSPATPQREQAEHLLFTEMCEICLWGNATDLSLLTNLSYADIQNLQGAAARKQAEKNILVNDLPAAFACLKTAQRSARPHRRVDIVLDNAGFELFVDLALAGYLLHANLATTVVLHPKNIPWFVSDVLPTDFADLLGALAYPSDFYDTPSDANAEPLSEPEAQGLGALFTDWAALHAAGRIVLRPNAFWTSAGSFWRLPAMAPALLADLRESELVIFKGDLNYRKLTGDAMWDPTTPFADAIGPMGTGSGVNVLALRTAKADVVVGLREGEDERLRAVEGGGGKTGKRMWAWSGRWAQVSFCGGKG